jgi:ribosome maturation protein SDO1
MIKQPVGIVNLTNVAIVRLKVNKDKFEIACYKNKIKQYREKIETDISEVIQETEIYSNAIRGDKVKKSMLNKTFPNMSKDEIMTLILDKGVYQISEKEREFTNTSVKNDLANIICEKTFDLATGKQFSAQIILQALDDIGANIINHEDAKKQALKFIKEIQEKGKIRMERKYIKIGLNFKGEKDYETKNDLIKYLLSTSAIIENEQEFTTSHTLKLICLINPNFYRELLSKYEKSKCFLSEFYIFSIYFFIK